MRYWFLMSRILISSKFPFMHLKQGILYHRLLVTCIFGVKVQLHGEVLIYDHWLWKWTTPDSQLYLVSVTKFLTQFQRHYTLKDMKPIQSSGECKPFILLNSLANTNKVIVCGTCKTFTGVLSTGHSYERKTVQGEGAGRAGRGRERGGDDAGLWWGRELRSFRS